MSRHSQIFLPQKMSALVIISGLVKFLLKAQNFNFVLNLIRRFQVEFVHAYLFIMEGNVASFKNIFRHKKCLW